MFRYTPPEKVKPRLICPACGFETQDIPMHHDSPMKWKLIKSFRKLEVLACRSCEYIVEMPRHCGLPMMYSEAEYDDLPTLTSRDLEVMREPLSSDKEGSDLGST